MTEITFGSLFAGIGGLDLGFERAGMVPKWQIEKDDYCLKVLENHWPGVKRYRDVRECGKHNLEPVDVAVGGFPCQPHSLSGKRKGAEDDRDLWPEYRRIVEQIRPDWVVGENVVGIRTTILDQVLSDLEDLDYTTTTFNIPACAFDAWHQRQRIFILANANECQVLRDQQQGLQNAHTGRNGGQGAVAHTNRLRQSQPERCIDALRGRACDGCQSRSGGRCSYWTIEPGVARVVHGLPHRLDRNRALSNAVVPQVAEFVASAIVEVIRNMKESE